MTSKPSGRKSVAKAVATATRSGRKRDADATKKASSTQRLKAAVSSPLLAYDCRS